MEKEELIELYFNQKLSIRDIAKLKKCKHPTIRYYFKKFGLTPRSSSESCKLRCVKKPQSNPGRKDMPKRILYGAERYNYKGGHIRKDGYKLISVDGEQRLEHRWIWEQNHQKPIPREFQVHHINGIKTDNRIENLKLLSNAEHQKLHNQPRNKVDGRFINGVTFK